MSTLEYSGCIAGDGHVYSSLDFTYKTIGVPPSGDLPKKYRPVLTNKNRYPYRMPSGVILSKLDLYKGRRLSYLKDIPVELWLNYSGVWQKHEDATTNRLGSVYITHSTGAMPNIKSCQGIAKATVNGKTYISNVVRYNFKKKT